jgi:hypothetical protein
MKTTNIKKTVGILAVVASITFSSVINAEEITLPKIAAPQALQEGIQRELSAAQIAELLPWAKDSKMFLNDLLENTQGLATLDQIERLSDGLKQVVEESSTKHAELLMRYSLNRALVLINILNKEMNADAVGTADAKLRILRSSIKMAIRYYEIDLNTLSKKTASPFVNFGLDYFDFLSELNKSVFDASAQYAIQRTALEWFQWDLYRDVNNASFAPQIVKINNSLKSFPNRAMADGQSLSYLRQMKAIATQIKSNGTLSDIINRLTSERERAENSRSAEENQRRQAEERQAELRNRTYSRLSKGSLVIYGGNIRTVEYVTDKDEVVMSAVRYQFTQDVAPRTSVEKAMTSYKNYTAGNVILNGDTVRTLEYIGEFGTVVLKAVQYSYTRDMVDSSRVSQGVASYKQFAVGDAVLYLNNVRKIAHLDQNGRVVLESERYKYTMDFTTASSISKIK